VLGDVPALVAGAARWLEEAGFRINADDGAAAHGMEAAGPPPAARRRWEMDHACYRYSTEAQSPSTHEPARPSRAQGASSSSRSERVHGALRGSPHAQGWVSPGSPYPPGLERAELAVPGLTPAAFAAATVKVWRAEGLTHP